MKDVEAWLEAHVVGREFATPRREHDRARPGRSTRPRRLLSRVATQLVQKNEKSRIEHHDFDLQLDQGSQAVDGFSEFG